MKDIIKLDTNNYRIHGDRNKKLIHKSLAECGAGRSILLDGEDVIIAGNGVYEQAVTLGLPIRIIESDGTELIAIKRSDLKTGDTRRKSLALADNLTSDTSIFNSEAILKDFTTEDLDAWEFEVDIENISLLGDIEENSFRNAVNESADIFTVSFSFPKSMQADMDAYIKSSGKDTLTQIIISAVCQSVEAK